jgi:hypothetical protein
LAQYNYGTPWGWYKCIEKCRSDFNVNIVKIKIYVCALLVEIKTTLNMHGTYIKNGIGNFTVWTRQAMYI